MDVTLIDDNPGTHWEPEYDSTWNSLTRLQWHAGVCAAESGLEVQVRLGVSRVVNEPLPEGTYEVSVNGLWVLTGDFKETRRFLIGVSVGAIKTKEQNHG